MEFIIGIIACAGIYQIGKWIHKTFIVEHYEIRAMEDGIKRENALWANNAEWQRYVQTPEYDEFSRLFKKRDKGYWDLSAEEHSRFAFLLDRVNEKKRKCLAE